MATTTNYGWTTPDDTGLVKDGASAIRTLGSSIDTTTKALNPSTTLGDIEYRSSTANTNTRLAIGTTGQVLTVAGGVPSWATIATGGDNWSLLNSGGTSLSGAATITVSGISGRNKIMLLIANGSSTNASAFGYVQLNGDTASNYYYSGSSITSQPTYNTQFVNQTAGTDNGIIFARMSDSTTSSMSGFCVISGCNSSGIKQIQAGGGADASGGNYHSARNVAGYYNSSSTISSVSVYVNTGTWDAGTLFVYATN